MQRIQKYILKQISFSTFFVACLLIGSLWTIQSLKFIEIFLKSGESFPLFLSFILLALPDLLVSVLPLTTSIAIIYVYNKLQVDQELTAFFSVGLTRWQIAKPGILFSLGITLLIYSINIFVLPFAFQKMRDKENTLKTSLPSLLLQEGVFNNFNDITLYMNHKDGQNLYGILAHVHKKNEKPYTIIAKEGHLIMNDKSPQIIMVQGNRQELNRGNTSSDAMQEKNLSILYFDQTTISLEEAKKVIPKRSRKPYELSLKELFDNEQNSYHTSSYRQRLYAEGYHRILSPWYVVVLSIFSLAVLVRPASRRNIQFLWIIKAGGGAILIQILCLSLINLGSHTLYPLIMAYIVVIVTILFSLIYLWDNKFEPYTILSSLNGEI